MRYSLKSNNSVKVESQSHSCRTWKSLEHENLRISVKFSLGHGLNLTFLNIRAGGQSPLTSGWWWIGGRGRAGLVLGEFIFPDKFNHKEE